MWTACRFLLEKWCTSLLRFYCLANKISFGFKRPPSPVPMKREWKGERIKEVGGVACCCKLVQLHSECVLDFYLCKLDLERLWSSYSWWIMIMEKSVFVSPTLWKWRREIRIRGEVKKVNGNFIAWLLGACLLVEHFVYWFMLMGLREAGRAA